ncbi:Retrotransposon gag protein [Quillaja saponaria]|uniref:Retrotransposon gag protein n=1 Tax=Quillaja saponaria TaxID=32244 RepID=A0AAD7LN99_QUISA|nr:Retrotransposon gag protein [Quillaja saponaria]
MFAGFNGERFSDWMYWIEQFFDVDNTPESAKVKLASINLEGRALQWHKAYMSSMTGIMVYWGRYIGDMSVRFGQEEEGDPLGRLSKLKQTGSVQEYQAEFESLLNQVSLLES